MEDNINLVMENIILKVDNFMQKNTILEMKFNEHIKKYQNLIK